MAIAQVPGNVGPAIMDGRIRGEAKEQDGESSGSTTSAFMSERQKLLDAYWQHYRCKQYHGRPYDWDGKPAQGMSEKAQVIRHEEIPPGFTDESDSGNDLSMRRPSAPFYLNTVVVNRFTSMLFSAKRHPELTSDDPDTQDWMSGFADATRFWSQMELARKFGGAMGSVGIGFKFVDGKPFVEVFDPRWATPEFGDRALLTVARFEVLYQFSAEIRDEDGKWVPQAYWYRRVIDDNMDTVWAKVRVVENEEPDWEVERFTQVEHGLPVCPVVWIQNQQVFDEIDGDPDCYGAFEKLERIDVLDSQADRGTVANCDPTVGIQSDAEFETIRKGSGNALQVEKGGSVEYLEMDGSGIEKAMELSAKFQEAVLTMTRCALDRNEGGPSRTAQEVEHNFSAMTDQADVLRERYGEAIKRLLKMVLEAVKALAVPKLATRDDGVSVITNSAVTLPKKKVIDGKTGTVTYTPRVIGKGEEVDLVWPDYFTPSQDVIAKKVEAAGKALEFGLVDREHAVQFVARDFGVKNIPQMIATIKLEQKAGLGMSPLLSPQDKEP